MRSRTATPARARAPRAAPSTNGNGNGSKAVTFTPAQAVTWDFHAPAGTHYNYKAEVGDGLGSSVLVALLTWLMRTFPEAPPIVQKRENEQWRDLFRHPLAVQLAEPNPFYGGRVLWMATCLDFAFGNAYWLKERNAGGELIELWWIPAALIRPKWDAAKPGVFIDHYDYVVNGRTIPLATKDVVHFRFGCDPANVRLGFTPLNAMMREIYVDDQASNFTASLLRNMGIVGVVVSPDGTDTMPADKVKETKEFLQREFTGDKRGRGLVFGRATKVSVLNYNVQGLDVGPIRDIAEERLSAALGIPAAVVGFGTGLQQTKVGATMRELIQQAWNGCIMPMQAIMAEELDRSLLPEFQAATSTFRTQFDTSEVRALQEDSDKQAERLSKLTINGVMQVAEARRELGLTVGPEHEVYYRPNTVTAVKQPGEEVQPPAPPKPAPAEPPAGGGGNPPAGGNNA